MMYKTKYIFILHICKRVRMRACMRACVVCNAAACFDFIYLVLEPKDNKNNINLEEDTQSVILSISERIHGAIIYEIDNMNISSFLQLSDFPRLIFAFSRFLF